MRGPSWQSYPNPNPIRPGRTCIPASVDCSPVPNSEFRIPPHPPAGHHPATHSCDRTTQPPADSSILPLCDAKPESPTAQRDAGTHRAGSQTRGNQGRGRADEGGSKCAREVAPDPPTARGNGPADRPLRRGDPRGPGGRRGPAHLPPAPARRLPPPRPRHRR